jgi:putative Holliday junction resolvase
MGVVKARGRVLAVDPGEARLGLAISDPSQTIARPLMVLTHQSRKKNAAAIAALAEEQQATCILVGVALQADGSVGMQARRALRLVRALQAETALEIHTWDERYSTQEALKIGPADGLLDARAAAVILQDYLDARAT